MATVIPLRPRRAKNRSSHAPCPVLSLRDRLFLRACDEAWAQRLADERERRVSMLTPRHGLRVVRP